MNKNKIMLALAISAATLLIGCKNMDINQLTSAGMTAYKAATLSDADAKALADAACQEMDSQNAVAPASSPYSKRLVKIANSLGHSINNTPVNYKVYMVKDVNAWAMANGCVRVYSGLMDMMTDDEVKAVLGHELGHVALGHSRKAMQTAYSTVAARDAISASGGAAAALSKSQLGDVAEGIVNSAFSRSQETESDNFAYDLLKKRNINPAGLVTSFEKLAKLSAGHEASLFDSHPPSEERAQNIRDRIAADK